MYTEHYCVAMVIILRIKVIILRIKMMPIEMSFFYNILSLTEPSLPNLPSLRLFHGKLQL